MRASPSTWGARQAPGGALAPEPPRATRFQPELSFFLSFFGLENPSQSLD